jgi:tetratricopeptide (TPR) repeat protein
MKFKRTIDFRIRVGFFVSTCIVGIIGACTTTSDSSIEDGFGSHENSYSDELTGSSESGKYVYSGPMAVKQIGQSQIAYSREGNQYWYNLRDSNDPLKKIAGYLARGQTTQAINGAKNYLEKNPQDIQAIIYLSTALALDKKYTLALYYAKAGLRLRPGDAILLNTAGLSLYLSDTRSPQDRKTAIEYLKTSFRNDPSQIASGLNLGGIFLELGKPTEAQVYYQATAKRCGQCKTALLGSGNAHLKNKNYSEAKVVFEKIIAQEPFNGPALYNLAVVYRNGYQNRKQAEKYLFTLLNRAPKSDYALRARAQTFLRMMKGEMDKSERAIAHDDYESMPQVNNKFDDTQDAEMLMTWGAQDDAGKK